MYKYSDVHKFIRVVDFFAIFVVKLVRKMKKKKRKEC